MGGWYGGGASGGVGGGCSGALGWGAEWFGGGGGVAGLELTRGVVLFRSVGATGRAGSEVGGLVSLGCDVAGGALEKAESGGRNWGRMDGADGSRGGRHAAFAPKVGIGEACRNGWWRRVKVQVMESAPRVCGGDPVLRGATVTWGECSPRPRGNSPALPQLCPRPLTARKPHPPQQPPPRPRKTPQPAPRTPHQPSPHAPRPRPPTTTPQSAPASPGPRATA